MRPVRYYIAAAALAALSLVSAQAQTPARPAGPAPATGGAQPAAGTFRLAVIDSGAFSDDKAGILRVVSAVKQVDAQFQSQRTELQGMQERYNTLVADIQKKAQVQDPKVTAQQQDQAEQLQLQIKRKAEDAQAAYQKRMGDVLDPLQADVYNALQAFAQARGISLIIDLNRNPSPVLYAADSVDITRDFITEYNRTHPATAAAATPGAPSTGRPE
ncbi:MAG TPA: OmpH family outer membrane protein [Pyrinomonadaceae bacterium]|jgi:outer membrane protein